MNADVHEKILSSLEGVDTEVRELVLKAIQLADRTTADTIAAKLFKELNNFAKGD